MNQDNLYYKRQDDLEEAKKLWQESEWLLNFLRTIEAEPPKQPNEEELLQWYNKNNSSTALWS
jgi:hypothetical protein